MGNASAVFVQALQHHREGRLAEAERAYRQILAVEPNHADAWHFLGLVASQSGNHELAVQWIRRALALTPASPDAHTNLGIALSQQGKHDEAVAEHRKALELRPDFPEALNNLGMALKELDDPWEAAECFERALALDPAPAEFHDNLGLVLHEQGKYAEADRSHGRALERDPNYANACWCRAVLALLSGDFERGWPEFEWRWKTGRISARDLPQPRWCGERLEGRTVLLHAEQGFGDTFQFIRYAPLVKERGGKTVVECQRPLAKVLARCPGVDRLVARGDVLPPVDVQTPLLSLPGIFKTTLESIPASVPYMFADAMLAGQWREKLHGLGGFRVGINWAGRTSPGFRKQRDIRLEHFAKLAQVPNVQLISLQKGEGREDLVNANAVGEAHPTIVDLGDEVDTANGAFMDTAAIMMNLDLVITSDTSVAHLAGALGAPVWVALPFVPDWRWMLDRSDSPWYPTMRLFRQKRAGDWVGVFEEIRAVLEEIVAGKSQLKGLRQMKNQPQ